MGTIILNINVDNKRQISIKRERIASHRDQHSGKVM